MMIGVDVGGTFTDVVAISSEGIRTVKVATDVRNTEKGVIQGAREAGVEAASVFNHASTHGLNAVITRRLPKIAFLTTLGHRDILDVGRVWRPPNDLTNPHWRRSFGDADRPLVPRYLRRGIRERIAASGSVLIPLDEAQARQELEVLARCEVQGVAICLLNAYVTHRHEERLRELVREVLGPIPCSISSEVSPLAKEFARASTTVIDVFMHLIYGAYTTRLGAGLRKLGFKGGLNYANCAAQLIPADVAMKRPFEIVFAGPAAGTVASAHFGAMIGSNNLMCVDVGGTSLPAVLELVHAAEVIVPPHPGLFSALGLVSSDQVYGDSRSAYTTLTPDAAPAINRVYQDMEARLREQLSHTGRELRIVRAFDGRLVGQTWETPFIEVPSGTIDAAAVAKMISTFHDVYQSRSGNRFAAGPEFERRRVRRDAYPPEPARRRQVMRHTCAVQTKPSFPRRRESSRRSPIEALLVLRDWIPAFAGMTVSKMTVGSPIREAHY